MAAGFLGFDRSRWCTGALALGLAACGDDATQAGDGSSTTDAGETSSSSVTASTTQHADESGSSESSTGHADSTGTGGSSSDGGTVGSSSSSTDPTDPTTGEDSSSGGPVVNTMCPIGTLGPAVPSVVFGNTIPQTDDFEGSCGGAGSPDAEFTFVAPADGTYTFDTHGSQLDTLLYVLDATCDGSELGCNDDGDGHQSALSVTLLAGQSVTVVVDGHDASGGPFNLRVQGGGLTCPLGAIEGPLPTTISGNTAFLFDGSDSTCGGQAGPDASYTFTAPAAGTYSFNTFGSSFESIVHVRDGVCGGNQLACGQQGSLVALAQGQEVTVTVDSLFASGTFDLHVDVLGGACPDTDLGNTVPQTATGNTTGGDNTDAGSCGGDFSADDLYEFTAPADGLYQFDTFGSSLDTVLFLRDAACFGPELECSDDFAQGDTDSRIIEGLDANQTVLIGVDGNGVGPYTLNVDLVPCPNGAISSTVPQNVVDSTVNGIDKLKPSCGQAGTDDESPDDAFSFTAPEDGIYTFDTLGVFWNTVIYVLDGAACNGDEIACNDNYQFNSTSALAVTLAANQTVTVVVDGTFEDAGAYTLHVNQLGGTCPDADLGSDLPASVSDSTAATDNAAVGSCGGLTGNDASYTWTAPADGSYRFSTAGSSFPAIVHVRDGADCGGTELDCHFSQFTNTSVVVVTLTEGQTVVATVDGEGDSGNFTLTIDEAPEGGNCCIAHMATGCEVPDIEDCVCAMDGFCCMVQWDDLCASEAVNPCGAAC